ncbi:DUF2000 family protein [Azospirillum griseum]|uniref:DUF2000 family protein n=1 Tax=Azospirillum griseum TaxID=2496639 RepID=A0A3S0I414_9PROT|nr:DUF2000 family protein [Azospirillum griseum]RTR23666.1 DUF2000 family protein [Azospirillum griseum]
MPDVSIHSPSNPDALLSAPIPARVSFDGKIALIVRDDLAVWQKLNVAAFLASGIAASAPQAIGDAYADGAGRRYSPMLGQPVLVFSADLEGLRGAHRVALERGLTIVPYVAAMFSTGHDAANRAAFAAGDPDALDWVGIALHGAKKAVDKAIKGLILHG